MVVFNQNEQFKKHFPKHPPELIRAIIEQSNLLIGEKLLKGDDYMMPNGLGVLFIGKFKNQRVFDYVHFCKTGEFKKQNNIKTFGYLYKIMWFKGCVNHTKKALYNNLYKFHASRYKIKRPLAQILKAGNDYYKDEEYINKFYYRNGKSQVQK